MRNREIPPVRDPLLLGSLKYSGTQFRVSIPEFKQLREFDIHTAAAFKLVQPHTSSYPQARTRHQRYMYWCLYTWIAFFFFIALSCLQVVAATHTTATMSSLIRKAPLMFPATARHTATVIFMHGLGDSGYGWAPAIENFRMLNRLSEVKFILPNAPNIPITCNGGYSMPGWYDIVALGGSVEDLRKQQDEAGILVSREYLRGLIQKEIDDGIPSDRIALGGFSQGAAMALFTSLTSPVKLAGIVAMSGYLPLDAKFPDPFLKEHDFNKETEILMWHGESDMVVPTQLGKSTQKLLTELGYKAEIKTVPGMGHSADPRELDDIAKFLHEKMPPKGDEGKSEL